MAQSLEVWSCDDITPDLCSNLQVQKGRVSVNGFDLAYWKYSKSDNYEDDDDDDEHDNDADDEDDNVLPNDIDGSSTTTAISENSPLVVVHGGPAWGHSYMLPLKQQACAGRTVYFYDQAGCGESSSSKKTTKEDEDLLLDIDYYAQTELPALLRAWNLTQFSLMGHGFGGMVALSYAIAQQKQSTKATSQTNQVNLKSLILLSTPSDIQLYYDAQWDTIHGTLGKLPPFTQERIHDLIHQEAYKSKEYQELVQAQYPLWVTRTWPLVACLRKSWDCSSDKDNYFCNMPLHNNIAKNMFGPSHDFMLHITKANLAGFNVTESLATLEQIPVLAMAGEWDSVRPIVLNTIVNKLNSSSFTYGEGIVIPNAANLLMLDQPKLVNDAIEDFLYRMEEPTPQLFVNSDHFNESSLDFGPWLALTFVILVSVGVPSCLVIGHRIQAHRRRTYELVA